MKICQDCWKISQIQKDCKLCKGTGKIETTENNLEEQS